MTPEEKQKIYKYLNEMTDKMGLPQPWNDTIRIFINAMSEESECTHTPSCYTMELTDNQIARRKIEEYKVEFSNAYDCHEKLDDVIDWLDQGGE